jgi:hypothetical protein
MRIAKFKNALWTLQKTWTLDFKWLKSVDLQVHVLRSTFWVHIFLWTFNFYSRSSRKWCENDKAL